jgi:hypothetical protein
MQPPNMMNQMQPHMMNQLETFPKDFPPATISKKFFAPAYVYKHFYLADSGKEKPMKVMKMKKKKESMLESLNPFGCESEEEDDEYEDDED